MITGKSGMITGKSETADRIAELLESVSRMTALEIAQSLRVPMVEARAALRADVRFEPLYDGQWQLTKTASKVPLP